MQKTRKYQWQNKLFNEIRYVIQELSSQRQQTFSIQQKTINIFKLANTEDYDAQAILKEIFQKLNFKGINGVLVMSNGFI